MRRGRGAAGRNVLGFVLIVVALAVLGGLASAAFLLRPPPTDPQTLCRTDQPLSAHTIVLVDSTDRLEPRHRRKLRAVLAQERQHLSEYDRLTVMRLNARRPQEPSVLFSKCLPLPPERTNPFFQNARMTQQQWDEEFQHALDTALRSAQAGGRGNASPILAALRDVAADPDYDASIAHRRLVLVSDMLEHDPNGFSLYVSGATYAAWRQQAQAQPAELSGVDLRIVPLDRPDDAQHQAEALANFWPAYFDAANVASVSIDPQP
ncbi:MAG: hypothetical protein HY054_03115 [Proteobacteria bacterium]|nr:hypothetical protein [Pseudomonadota bacterium]